MIVNLLEQPLLFGKIVSLISLICQFRSLVNQQSHKQAAFTWLREESSFQILPLLGLSWGTSHTLIGELINSGALRSGSHLARAAAFCSFASD